MSAATVAFAAKGVAGTSLDGLAAELGVTKQTILYHFGSKDGLVAATLAAAADDVVAELETAVDRGGPEWERIEGVVRASFAVAVRRPELLGLLREVSRLGPAWSSEVLKLLQPVVDRALDDLRRGMASGRLRTGDPEMVLVAAYAIVSGVVTGPEVLQAFGLELDLRVAVRLRRTLLSFLEAALRWPDESKGRREVPGIESTEDER